VLDVLRDRLGRRPGSRFFAGVQAAPVRKRYIIATSARSGSTFFCSRIADYGELGFPMEFLNESYISEFDRIFPNPSLADYERYVTSAFASKSGILGVKTDWWRFYEARKLGLFDAILEPVDLVVHLRREDFVAQAVSLALAVQTDVWHDRDVLVGTVDDRHADAVYDAVVIKRHARHLLNQEYYWNRFIAETGAPAIELWYEQVSKDVDGAIRSLADAFDLRLGGTPQRSDAVRQSRSNVAKSWRDRFHAECEDFVDFWVSHRGLISAA
jgi:LPS sulfotransferase NodH